LKGIPSKESDGEELFRENKEARRKGFFAGKEGSLCHERGKDFRAKRRSLVTQ